ncbi:MAG: hypothetical protein EBZ78_06155 [Verrucomicrobia bacterium]|nr:hypothetical protein [Verrucomicrobiota bacterium]
MNWVAIGSLALPVLLLVYAGIIWKRGRDMVKATAAAEEAKRQEGLFIQKQILFVLVKMLERQELTAEERESLLSTFRWQGRN